MTDIESIAARTLRQEHDRVSAELSRQSRLRADAARNVVTSEATIEAAKLLYSDRVKKVDAIIEELRELCAAYFKLTGSEMPVQG